LSKICEDDEIEAFLKLVPSNIKRIRLEKGISQLDIHYL
jgi:hypothetical protein